MRDAESLFLDRPASCLRYGRLIGIHEYEHDQGTERVPGGENFLGFADCVSPLPKTDRTNTRSRSVQSSRRVSIGSPPTTPSSIQCLPSCLISQPRYSADIHRFTGAGHWFPHYRLWLSDGGEESAGKVLQFVDPLHPDAGDHEETQDDEH